MSVCEYLAIVNVDFNMQYFFLGWKWKKILGFLLFNMVISVAMVMF